MIHFTLAEAAFALVLVAFKYLTPLLGAAVLVWLTAQSGTWMLTASRMALGLVGTAWLVSLIVNVWALSNMNTGEAQAEILTRAVTVDGHSLGAGDAVFRGDGGNVERVNLAEPRILAGIRVSGDVAFDAAGQLRHARLSGDQEIEQVPCAGDGDADFVAGRLDRCLLARAHRVNGVVLPAGTLLFAFASQETWCAELPEDRGTEIRGIAVPGGTSIRYDRVDRRPLRLNIRETSWAVIDDLRLTGTIDFTADGELETALVFDAVEIAGERHRAGTFVRFRQ